MLAMRLATAVVRTRCTSFLSLICMAGQGFIAAAVYRCRLLLKYATSLHKAASMIACVASNSDIKIIWVQPKTVLKLNTEECIALLQ